jgi:hypothetical protein
MARVVSAKHAPSAALMLLLSVPAQAAPPDAYDTLSRLIGHSKAELIQRFGQPVDTVTTIDGERLFYETLDTGRVGGVSGRSTRAGGPGGFGLFPGGYSFRCKTEVVIADGRVRAFNRSGNDCH